MDILKARKKAAEQKHNRKKVKPLRPDATRPSKEEPPLPAATEPACSVTALEDPALGTHTPVTEESAAKTPSGEEVTEQKANEIELLSFLLGGEAYALPVKDVREVLKMRTLTLVPNAPPYILGVTSLRGMVLPVIDLCTRIGLLPGVRDEKSRIIVVNSEDEDVGLIVDRVTGVLKIMPDATKPTPENIGQGAAFLSGIVRKDDVLYILLDLKKATGT